MDPGDPLGPLVHGAFVTVVWSFGLCWLRTLGPFCALWAVFVFRVRNSSIISMDISTYQVNIFDVDVVGAVVVVVHTIL